MPDKTPGPFTKITFNLTREHRDMLFDYATAQGVSMSDCLRRMIADKFRELREDQAQA